MAISGCIYEAVAERPNSHGHFWTTPLQQQAATNKSKHISTTPKTLQVLMDATRNTSLKIWTWVPEAVESGSGDEFGDDFR